MVGDFQFIMGSKAESYWLILAKYEVRMLYFLKEMGKSHLFNH